MKKIYLFLAIVCIFSFASSVLLSEHTKTKYFNHTLATEEEGGYNVVWVSCETDACVLNCFGGGSEECTWENGLNNGCIDCELFEIFFGDSDADDMWDHAINEIGDNTYSGSYNNHFIDYSSGYKYFRNVSWNYDTTTTARTINITITETDQY
jgi:hypothetical protein